MSGLLESLTAEEEAQLRGAEPAPEPVEEPKAPEGETEEQKAERLRDEAGKFAKEEDIAKKVVPLATHLEERKTLQRRIQELEAAQARERETLAQRLQRLESLAKEPETPKAPSWDDQPLEAGKHTAQEVEAIKRTLAQQAQEQHLANFVSAAEAEFAKSTPDYFDAANFLRERRAQELMLLGANQAQAAAQVRIEAMQIAIAAANAGKSPAEVAYQIAAQRGYQKKAAEPAKPDPAAVIEAAAKAAGAAKSLGTMGGSAADGRVTLEALAKMDESEFDKLTSDPKAWRKFMGGG